MPVDRIEYQADSLKPGFAEAGDTVTIDESNADTIQDDVDAGVTEEPTAGQSAFLEDAADSVDSTDYDTGEEGMGSENEFGSGQNGQDNGTSAGYNSSAAGLMFGAATASAVSVMSNFMNANVALPLGAVDLALAYSSIANVAVFDTDFAQRVSYLGESDSDISSLNAQLEILNEDMEKMEAVISEDGGGEAEETDAASEGGEAGAAEESGGGEETDIQSLLDQLNDCIANGDEAGANEIREMIAAYLDENSGEGENEDLTAEPMSNNENANSLNSHCTSVKEILSEGAEIGAMGLMNTAYLAMASANSSVMAPKAFIGATPWTLGAAMAGGALCLTASSVFKAASIAMGVKSATEIACGVRGANMESSLNIFQNPLQEHETLIGEVQSMEEEKSEQSTEMAADVSSAMSEMTSSGGAALTGSAGSGGGVSSSAGGSSTP